MNNSVRRFSVLAGFLLLLALLAVNTAVTRRQLEAQIDAHYWVEHTQAVLLDLAQIDSLLTRSESGQRGFLLAGDARYLETYKNASVQVEPYINQIAQLTADNPVQQARIPQLRELTRKKLDELAQTIRLADSGQTVAARELVQTNFGLLTMDKTRALLSGMRDEELALQSHRTQAYAASVHQTIASIYLTSLAAAVGLAFLAFYILREIRLREHYAEQIRQREEWFRVTLTSIGDGVVATDEKGHVTFMNSVAEEMSGTRQPRALGQEIQRVLPLFNESTHQPVANPVSIVMEKGLIVGLANHTVLERPDGTTIPIEDSAAPIRDDKNKLIGVVLVFRDASKDRKAQEILRKTEKLAAAARLAATVAHEINNPLEAVGNILYLVKASPGLSKEAVENLSLAEQELERVAHITKQTLGFYRESGGFDVVNVAELLESVLKLFDNKMQSKKIRLEKHVETCEVRGRTGELRQVIANLVSNAIDAVAPNGNLKLQVSCVSSASGPAIQISVEDDGPGVDPQHMQHIFEPFYTTKKDVGTGLGLWVSRQIVERHGGSISVDSSRNGRRGACFTVVLPAIEDHDLQSISA